MASPEAGPSDNATTATTKPINFSNPLANQPTKGTPVASTPLEMSTLDTNIADADAESKEPISESYPQSNPPLQFDPPLHQKPEETSDPIPQNQAMDPAALPPLKREQTAPAIGPSSDKPMPLLKEGESDNVLMITLLLTSGSRHPYKLDEKYLKKRNVSVEGDNPINLSIYDLKNLIWKDWRDDWEPRPTNPTSIRLIYAGHMPGDSSKLGDCRFSLGATPHVVHMTVKPQDFIDDEEAGKGHPRDREGLESSPRCRCCIVM